MAGFLCFSPSVQWILAPLAGVWRWPWRYVAVRCKWFPVYKRVSQSYLGRPLGCLFFCFSQLSLSSYLLGQLWNSVRVCFLVLVSFFAIFVVRWSWRQRLFWCILIWILLVAWEFDWLAQVSAKVDPFMSYNCGGMPSWGFQFYSLPPRCFISYYCSSRI